MLPGTAIHALPTRSGHPQTVLATCGSARPDPFRLEAFAALQEGDSARALASCVRIQDRGAASLIAAVAFEQAGDPLNECRVLSSALDLPATPQRRSQIISSLLDHFTRTGRADRAEALGRRALETLPRRPMLVGNFLGAVQQRPEHEARALLTTELRRLGLLHDGQLADPLLAAIVAVEDTHQLLREHFTHHPETHSHA